MRAVTMTAVAMALCLCGATSSAQGSDPDKLVADGGVKVAGWKGRLDPRPAAAGRKITDAKFYSMGKGIHATAGPAAIYWNPANVARGNYTVQAKFSQTKASAHPEAYGLLLAGTNLEASNQAYLYFVIRQDGKYFISHRANDSTVHKMVDWTTNAAVKAMDAAGKATNLVAVVVGVDKLSFRVNGTEVHSLPRSVIDAAGPHSGTAGIAGIRVNHNLDVHIDGFAVTRAR
ncbi:MAG: hypothetical protein ABIR58_00025 [Gemmatimonadaceae bacterium]